MATLRSPGESKHRSWSPIGVVTLVSPLLLLPPPPTTTVTRYWEQYGRDLFTYSYYLDAYNVTHNATDLAIAKTAEAKVPSHIVDKFVWRRARNFNVTSALVADLVANRSLFQYMYITQDDNALYGFNIEEANKFKAMVKQHKLAVRERACRYVSRRSPTRPRS